MRFKTDQDLAEEAEDEVQREGVRVRKIKAQYEAWVQDDIKR